MQKKNIKKNRLQNVAYTLQTDKTNETSQSKVGQTIQSVRGPKEPDKQTHSHTLEKHCTPFKQLDE